MNNFLRSIISTLLAFSLFRNTQLCAMAPPPPSMSDTSISQPNIVLIVADDLGYGDPGCYGQKRIHTPCIDKMAEEGMRCTHFYAGAPVSAPSRATLMTGLHSGHCTVDRNASPNLPLGADERTCADVLNSHGYFTEFIGKWGLGGATPSEEFGGTFPHLSLPQGGGNELLPETAHSLPTRKGFTSSYAIIDQAYAHQHFPEYIWVNETVQPVKGNINKPLSERTEYAQDMFTGHALNTLENADGKHPLFMVVSYLIPHRQLIVPANVSDYADESWPPQEKAYAAMITLMDRDVGRILDAIDANPALAENTLVIFTSDNGPHKADGHSPDFFASAGGLRGMKFTLYEGGIRVPCIARWKGHIKPGTVTDTPCGFSDIFATVCGLVNVAQPYKTDGVSLAPLFTQSADITRNTPLIWYSPPPENTPKATIAALRSGRWKYIILADGTPELYDISVNPAENNNCADAQPELIKTFYKTLTEQLRQPLPPLTFTAP